MDFQEHKKQTVDDILHTPGPWAWREKACNAYNGVIIAETSGLHVAEMRNICDQTKHNAKLIATAPAMLAALKLIAGGADNAAAIATSAVENAMTP